MKTPAGIRCEDLDGIKDRLPDVIETAAGALPGFLYGDVRLEAGEGTAAWAENGEPKAASRDYELSLGVRVIAGNGRSAAGHCGLTLGPADLPGLEAVVRDALRQAHERARASAARKADAAARFPRTGASLAPCDLAPIQAARADVPAVYEVDPRRVDPQHACALCTEVSKAVAGVGPAVRYNVVEAHTSLTRLLFASSEGALIDRSHALTQGLAFVVAHDGGVTQEHYDHLGHQRGWEILERGVTDEPLLAGPGLHEFATARAREAVELCSAPALRATEGEVVVLTDPHFNTLLVHEIVGHPTELDRGLKWETAYAGRSWLLDDTRRTRLGERIASPLLSAYSDPGLPGFGHYEYDHEGTPARKVMLIERGVLTGFMNSRQTAAVMGAEPNGHYVATDASLVPLIRMSNTVFAAGDTRPEQLIGEVEHGYYLVGMRTPSISESRENFRITARKVYEIRNGRIGQLYRDGGITADSRDFLSNVAGVGSDFRLYPIPNCGKGQPMQVKRLGNGGPTLRSRARLTGAG